MARKTRSPPLKWTRTRWMVTGIGVIILMIMLALVLSGVRLPLTPINVIEFSIIVWRILP